MNINFGAVQLTQPARADYETHRIKLSNRKSGRDIGTDHVIDIYLTGKDKDKLRELKKRTPGRRVGADESVRRDENNRPIDDEGRPYTHHSSFVSKDVKQAVTKFLEDIIAKTEWPEEYEGFVVEESALSPEWTNYTQHGKIADGKVVSLYA